MAQLRHIALVVKDLERAAAFYQAAFGMRRSETTESQTAFRIYLSDGVMNLALLQYKGETGSGLKDGGHFSGPHHFGFMVDDLEEAGRDIEAAGGVFFFDLGKPGDEGFERKFRDPDGTIFDINTQGWPVEFAPAAERHAAE
jgi:catechol 2,3-dioxygenase-like lactoylglutathione lyase family enzyme